MPDRSDYELPAHPPRPGPVPSWPLSGGEEADVIAQMRRDGRAGRDPAGYAAAVHAAAVADVEAAIDRAAARRRTRTDMWLRRAHAALWGVLAVWLVAGIVWWAVTR